LSQRTSKSPTTAVLRRTAITLSINLHSHARHSYPPPRIAILVLYLLISPLILISHISSLLASSCLFRISFLYVSYIVTPFAIQQSNERPPTLSNPSHLRNRKSISKSGGEAHHAIQNTCDFGERDYPRKSSSFLISRKNYRLLVAFVTKWPLISLLRARKEESARICNHPLVYHHRVFYIYHPSYDLELN